MLALKGSNFSFPAPLLFQNKDLRIALAYELYKEEKITLGKASEIIQEKPTEVKALFKAREL